jgi:hypothetical protein
MWDADEEIDDDESMDDESIIGPIRRYLVIDFVYEKSRKLFSLDSDRIFIEALPLLKIEKGDCLVKVDKTDFRQKPFSLVLSKINSLEDGSIVELHIVRDKTLLQNPSVSKF